jgi:hypothetical protein
MQMYVVCCLLLILSICANSTSIITIKSEIGSKYTISTRNQSSRVPKKMQSHSTRREICKAASNIDSAVSAITANPMRFVAANHDECVLSVIDSIVIRYRAKKDVMYLDCISNLCVNADGYLSDALGTAIYKMFLSDVYKCSSYMYNNRTTKYQMLLLFTYEIKIENRAKQVRALLDRHVRDSKMRRYILAKVSSQTQ